MSHSKQSTTVQTNLNVGDQSSTVIFQTAVTSLLKAVCVVMYVPVLASVDNVDNNMKL